MKNIRAAYQEQIETRRPVVQYNDEPSRTKQSLADALDVNNIIKRYHQTGVLQQAHEFEGVYGDFSSYDLREAIEKVQQSNELFLQVPSEIRAKFDNDAGAFIDYATNRENIGQLRDWGLANPQPPSEDPNKDLPPQTQTSTKPDEKV